MKIQHFLLTASAALLALLPAQGATVTTFNNTSGDGLWNTASNWSAGIPTNADTATVSAGKSATVASGVTAVGNIINVGNGTSGIGAVTVSGGTIDVTGSAGAGELRVGWSGATGTGTSTLSLINGGSVTGFLLAIARGPNSYTVYDSYQGWVKVDATSNINVSTLELARRGRTGTLELLASTVSSGASVAANTLTMGTASGTANLIIGQNATVTVTTTANLAGTSGTSSITVNGGSFIMQSLSRVHGHATFYLTNATVAAATLQVLSGGTLSADVRVAGTSVSGTSINAVNFVLAGGGVLDGNLVVDGSSTASFGVALSGALGSVAVGTVGDASFVSGGTITIDFTSVTGIAEGSEVTVLLADSITGLSLSSILSTGLDPALTAVYSFETSGTQQALIATITAIPEPAVAAAVMALLALTAVMRRRQ